MRTMIELNISLILIESCKSCDLVKKRIIDG